MEYRDIDIAFVAHPETGQLPLLKNERAIARSIRNLVLTNKYERPFQPNIFSNVTASLFENMGTVELMVLEDNIRQVLANYEPRAEIKNVDVKGILDREEFTVSITFTPLNSTRDVTVNVILERVR